MDIIKTTIILYLYIYLLFKINLSRNMNHSLKDG